MSAGAGDGMSDASTSGDTVQAREPDDATIARAFPAAEALAEAWWVPRHPGVGWSDLPATVRDDYVQTAREWINAAQAVAGPSGDTVQPTDVAALPPEVVAVLEAAQRLMVEWHGKPLSSGPRALGEAVRALLATGTTPAVAS